MFYWVTGFLSGTGFTMLVTGVIVERMHRAAKIEPLPKPQLADWTHIRALEKELGFSPAEPFAPPRPGIVEPPTKPLFPVGSRVVAGTPYLIPANDRPFPTNVFVNDMPLDEYAKSREALFAAKTRAGGVPSITMEEIMEMRKKVIGQ